MKLTFKQLSILIVKKYKNDQEKISDWYGKYNRVRNKRKQELIKRQNCKCDVCSVEMITDQNVNSVNYATIEHVIPLAEGGIDDPSNWTITCVSCNRARSTMNYEYFKSNYISIKKRLLTDRLYKLKKKSAGELSEKDILRRNKICFGLAILFIMDNKNKKLLETCVIRENKHTEDRENKIKNLQLSLSK